MKKDFNHSGSFAGEVLTRCILLLLGLMLMLPAANLFFTYCHLHLFGIHTEGTVSHSSSGRGLGGRPLIEYHDAQGIFHEFKSKAKTHWLKRPVKGERIALIIDSRDPGKVVVKDFFYYVFFPLVFVAAGSYCCFESIWLRSSRRRRKATSR